MQFLKIITLLFVACVLAIVALVLIKVAPRVTVVPNQAITNFEECAAAGNPVMESYPRQCRAPDGQLFVEEIPGPTSNDDLGLQANGCAVAGCSGQLCVSADEAGDIITTCEYRAEYACFKEASCEPQADGQCGWTMNQELQQCLVNPPVEELEVM